MITERRTKRRTNAQYIKQHITMNHTLPQHIIESEILTRLPMKSLLKFRCVSKSWYSFISDNNRVFVKSHLKNYTNNKTTNFKHQNVIAPFDQRNHHKLFKQCSLPCLLDGLVSNNLAFPSDKFTTINYNFSQLRSGLRLLVGSCNGLCCILDYLEDSEEIYLWNPTTGKSHSLPHADYIETERHRLPTTWCGFGFDEVHDDYKVLAITYIHPDVGVIGLYSLRANSWKVIENNSDTNMYLCHTYPKLLNGKLYWINLHADHDGRAVCCFDLEREKLGIVEQPNYDRDKYFYCLTSVGVLDGCLSCIYMNKDDNNMHVWVMKESWHLLVNSLCPFVTYCEPFCIGQGGEILFFYLDDINAGSEGIVMYDPKTKSCTHSKRNDIFRPVLYVPSLVSPVSLGANMNN